MDMKRFFLYAIAIAALALAGCGGNGNGGPTDMGMNGNGNGGTDVTCSDGTMAATEDDCPKDTTAADIVAETAAAATKLTAIGVSAGETGTADQGLGGAVADAAQDYMLAITRDAMKTTVTITDPNREDTDDSKFSTAMPLPDAGGFAGTMNVRDISKEDSDDTVVEIAVVRTDIKGPTPIPFELDGDNMGRYPLDANPETANGMDYQSLMIDSDHNLMAATMFSNPSGAGTVNFSGDTEATEEDEAAVVMGTFDGAMGSFKCNVAAGCSVTLADSKVATSTGWIFTPIDGETVAMLDTSYLAYGFWLQRTTDKDGNVTYDEVEAFTGGNVTRSDAGQIADIVGSAEYTGNSTGVYVKNVSDAQSTITSATAGLYNANVSLTANFGGGDIGANHQFRITGKVTDFVLQHGEENDWGVKLETADYLTGTRNEFGGTTVGDSTAAEGTWNGAFYGETPETADTEDGNARVAPPSVLGEMNANFTDGAVLGGFGAHKD